VESSNKSLILVATIILLITSSAVAENIMLGRPTDDSVTVNVIPDQNGEISFEYGTISGVYDANTSAVSCTLDEPVEVVIDSLASNTRYYYRLRFRATSGAPWTPRDEHSFHTQRAPGSTFTFTVIADSHAMYNAQYQQAIQNVIADQPDFHLDLGDTFMTDSDGSQSQVNEAYLAQRDPLYMGGIGCLAPIFIMPGNHENEEGWNFDDSPFSPALASIQARKLYYPTPITDGFYSGNDDTLAAIDANIYGDQFREDYYAWEWGDALFVVFDPFQYTMDNPYGNTAGEGSVGSNDPMTGDRWNWTLGQQQFDWFKQTLEDSNAKYKFIFAHHMLGGTQSYVRGGAVPAYWFEWGGYETDDTTWSFETKRSGWGDTPIHQFMVENGVSAFFHGHDHQYAYEVRDGIVYQCLPRPSTGLDFNYYNESDPYTERVLPSPGHLRVTVTRTEATVEYVRSNISEVSHSYAILPNETSTPEPLYRVNNGGPDLDMSLVGEPNFLGLTQGDLTAIPGLTATGDFQSDPSTTDPIDLSGVDPNLPEALFQTANRTSVGSGSLNFAFAVPNGQYNVILHWSEQNSSFTDPGDRVFDVFIEGVEELPNYDIAVATGGAGINVAVTEVVPTTVTDGELLLTITADVSVAIIRGIEIVPVVELVQHTITATSGANGSIDPSGAVSVTEGDDQSFSITPAGGYQVADVLVDSVSVGAVTSYEFTNVLTDHTISASFEESTVKVVTLDGAVSSGAADDVSSIDIPHTTGTGADRLMLVGVSWNCGTNARSISSVTFTPDGGAAVGLTEVMTEQTGTQERYSAIYSLLNPPSGKTGTVTVTFSGSVSNGIVAGVANFAGVNQTTPLGSSDGANENSTAPSVTLTGLNGNELVFDNVFQGASGESQTLTIGADQAEQWNAWIANARAAASTEQATGGSVTMSWTAASSSYWAIAAVAINPASTSPSPTINITDVPLTEFSSEPDTPSAEQSYTVSGSNLTDDITITPPSDFEISTTSGSGWTTSALILTQSGGDVAATDIYVRFNRATEGASSGDITHISSGAVTENVAVSGTATPITPISFNILLGRPTDDSVTVNVIPDQNCEALFEYGTGSGVYSYDTSIFPCTAEEPVEVVIDGLLADTRYYYRIVYSKNGVDWAEAAEEHSFHTQRAPSSTFTFTVTSDSHVNILLGSASIWTQTLNNVAADNPDFHIDLGDTVAMRSVSAGDVAGAEAAYEYQRTTFFDIISSSVPVFLVAGNHEQTEAWHLLSPLAGSLPVIGTNAMKKYFANPVPDDFYSGDENTYSYLDGDHLREDYYAWTWGDVLFVTLDPYWFTTIKPYVSDPGGGETDATGSGDTWDWTLGQEQYNWLKQTLENSNAKYKFVFAHQMTADASLSGQEDYGHGGANHSHLTEWGGDNENGTWGFDSQRPALDEPIHQMMVDNGVSAFFHGHDHQFAYEMRDGIVYQALPSAGFTGSGFNMYSTGSGYTIQALPNAGHLRVTVEPSEATVDYVAYNTGQVNYSYTIEPEPNVTTYDLTMAVSPSGSGTTDPSVGVHTYPEDTNVSITATPNTGYVFDHWEGDVANPVSVSATVTMDANQAVTAHFTEAPAGEITYIGDIGSVTSTTDGGTLTIDVDTDVAAGDTIIVAVASRGNQNLEYSVADSAGNSYAEAVQSISYSHGRTYIFYGYVNNALDSDDTITVTNTPDVAGRAAVASVFRGLAQDGLDQALGFPMESGEQVSSDNPSVGPVTTTQADELLIGAIGTEGPVGDDAGTWDNSFTAGPRDGTTGASYEWTISMGYRIVSSIGDYTAEKSGITEQYWAATIATFEAASSTPPIEYTITASAGANGGISPSGAVTVTEGNSQSFSIIPDGGYQVADVLVDGVSVGAVSSYEFINVQDDHTIEASFAINTFTLNYTAGAGGSLTGDTSQVVNYGEDGTAVTAVPDTGYHFVDWSDASTDNPRTDLNVTANINVTANFAIKTFTLNYAAGTGGSLTGDTSQVVNYGEDGTSVTAVPDTGYYFVDWSDTSTDNPRTDLNVTANISVTANFALEPLGFDYNFEITRLRYSDSSEQLTEGWCTLVVWPPTGKALTNVKFTLPGDQIIEEAVSLGVDEEAYINEEDIFGNSTVLLSEIEALMIPGSYRIEIECSDASSHSVAFERQAGSYPDFPNITYPTHNQMDVNLAPVITCDSCDLDWLSVWNISDDNETFFDLWDTNEQSYQIPTGTLMLNTEYELQVNRNEWGTTYLGSATLADFVTREASTSVNRSFDPAQYTPSETVSVFIDVIPDSSALVFTVEDKPPMDWTVDMASINESGVWDSVNSKVKWGPYYDNQPRTLSYNVTAASDANGTKIFNGVISCDGVVTLFNDDIQQADSNSPPLMFGYINGKNVGLTINDCNAVPVTFSLTGAGWGEIIDDCNIARIEIYDTTERSKFSIRTASGTETSVGDIIVYGSLQSISAKTVDLRGSITVTGSLRRLQLDDIADGHTITIGSSSNPRAAAKMTFDCITNLDVNSDIPISSFTATEWLSGSLIAPCVKTFIIKGLRDNPRTGIDGLPGDCNANIILTGFDSKGKSLGNARIAGTVSGIWEINSHCGNIKIGSALENWILSCGGNVRGLKVTNSLSGHWTSYSLGNVSVGLDINDANMVLSQPVNDRVKALKNVKVKRWIRNSCITSQGNVGKISASGVEDSSCCAGPISSMGDSNGDGVIDLPDPASISGTGGARIDGISIGGIRGYSGNFCINSNFAAAEINSITLSFPQYNNGGVPFGLAADHIRSVTIKDADGKRPFRNLNDSGDSITQQDTEIRIK